VIKLKAAVIVNTLVVKLITKKNRFLLKEIGI